MQFTRTQALASEDRVSEANDAVQESIRLLPEYSAPLLLASQIYAFQDRPGLAADYVIRASRIDPSIVNMLGDYEVGNILHRLEESGDVRSRIALSERLLEVGWTQGRFGTVSAMAKAVLDDRVERGDVQGAAAMVTKILSPAIFASLLTDNRFVALRPAVEAWAGPRLEKQWPIFLQEARAEWDASKNLEAGRTYAGALAAARHDDTLINTFRPLFEQRIDPEEDYDLLFIAPRVSSAFARKGRWAEADQLLERVLVAWPAHESANALNLSANRARLLVMKGEFADGIKQLDQALEHVKKWGGEVNQGAFAAMHLYRACALEQLGRGDEDIISEAIVTTRNGVNPTGSAYFQLCKNDLAAAKLALLDGLKTEDTRPGVLAWMQPSDDDTYASEFARTMMTRAERLKQDKELLAAVSKYGRILEAPINASAPEEQPPAPF